MIGGVRDLRVTSRKNQEPIMALERTEKCVGEIFSKGTRGGRNKNPWNQKRRQQVKLNPPE